MTVTCPKCGTKADMEIAFRIDSSCRREVEIKVITADVELRCETCQTQWEEGFVIK